MKLSQPIRIESSEHDCLREYGSDFRTSFVTSRTVNSLLWFVNNKAYEERVLSYLAKYQERDKAVLYGYVLQGNHVHTLVKFNSARRSAFFRDLNARMAEAARRFIPEFPGGKLFHRRYSAETIPLASDIKEYFFYCALQPVSAGLCEYPDDYPGYNSFHDAINGVEREYSVTEWGEYNSAKRYNSKLTPEDFTKTYKLKYERLPGYEQYTQEEYREEMLREREIRRQQIVAERKKLGLGFATRELLLETKPGTAPRSTKQSERDSKRPLVLTKCAETRKLYLKWYFELVVRFRKAVEQYRVGVLAAKFPAGMYRPSLLTG